MGMEFDARCDDGYVTCLAAMPLVMLAVARANVRALARARVLLLRKAKTEGGPTESYRHPNSEGVANRAE